MLAPPLLLSLTVHEFAHARMALAFGDPTAKNMGRVSLNPLRHLDPMGTLVLLMTQFMGWAKPVPVNPANLHPRRLGDIMVSLAGPLSNLFLAVIAGVLLRIWLGMTHHGQSGLSESVVTLLLITTTANLALCIFNLIPLFPLDGHHILREILPVRTQANFMQWQLRFGSLVLMAIIFGPRLITMMTGQQAGIDPLGFVFTRLIGPAIDLLLG